MAPPPAHPPSLGGTAPGGTTPGGTPPNGATPSGSARDGALLAFARLFFKGLGAPFVRVEDDLWYVDLDPHQREVLEPLSPLPWWARPPAPPETVRWWVALTPRAAVRRPDARLLTRHSPLFQRMLEACRRRGRVTTATLREGDRSSYRPVLWLHVRVIRRSTETEVRLEPWECDVARILLRPGVPPPPENLRPGPPPPGAAIERARMKPDELWRALVRAISIRHSQDEVRWTEAPLVRVAREEREVRQYYASLASLVKPGAAGGAIPNPGAGDPLAEEMARRLAEIRGRHLPRLIIEPLAVSLVYLPSHR